MAAALVMGRLLLAAVLAVAAVAKLRDLRASRRSVREFGIPRGPAALHRHVAAVRRAGDRRPAYWRNRARPLPPLPRPGSSPRSAWRSSPTSRRGRAPECNCFGRLHSAPAGWGTVARNLALIVVALGVAAGAGDPTVAAAFAAVTLACSCRRSQSPSIERAAPMPALTATAFDEGLAPGTPAPGFRLPARTGETLSLDSLLGRGRPVLLLFTDDHCGPCVELAPEVARWQRELAGDLAIAVIENVSNGSRPAGPDEHGRRDVLLQKDGVVSDAYRALGTPSGVLVAADGKVASEIAAGAVGIEGLISRTVDGFEPRSSTAVALHGFGEPVRRRELFVRAAGAWAATGFVLAWPARAAVALRAGQAPCPEALAASLRRSMHQRPGRRAALRHRLLEPEALPELELVSRDLRRRKVHPGHRRQPLQRGPRARRRGEGDRRGSPRPMPRKHDLLPGQLRRPDADTELRQLRWQFAAGQATGLLPGGAA